MGKNKVSRRFIRKQNLFQRWKSLTTMKQFLNFCNN